MCSISEEFLLRMCSQSYLQLHVYRSCTIVVSLPCYDHLEVLEASAECLMHFVGAMLGVCVNGLS